MYAEPFAPHHRAHFQAYYQEFAAVFAMNVLLLSKLLHDLPVDSDDPE